jgi:HD superfamily phosphohydrolase
VYPGAVHTRFEHSLGAVHQVQQLVDAINRGPSAQADESTTSVAPAIQPAQELFLRLAALCHDLGHGAMSHVSETALSLRSDIVDLRLEFQREHSHQKLTALSEMVCYYILGSPAFAELLTRADQLVDGPKPARDVGTDLQNAIIGSLVNERIPLIQQLISGPFDADKLDYMQRDAMMTGIPRVTDVPRLFGKVRAAWVDQKQLPSFVREQITAGAGPYLVFGMAYSGARTLDELLLARVLLFDKVYTHHKVRSLEGLVARIFEALASLYKGPAVELPYLLADEHLLDVAQVARRQPSFVTNTADGKAKLLIVADLCRRLRERDLFVRAGVFGQHVPGVASTDMVRLHNRAEGDRGRFTDELIIEIRVVAEALGETQLLDSLPDPTLRAYVWVDPPIEADHTQKVKHAILVREGDILASYQEHSREVANCRMLTFREKTWDLCFVHARFAISSTWAWKVSWPAHSSSDLPRRHRILLRSTSRVWMSFATGCVKVDTIRRSNSDTDRCPHALRWATSPP